MILADTSVWISFFRGDKNAIDLKHMLVEDNVVMHPYIFGELLLGGLSKRNEDLMSSLTFCNIIKTDKVYEFIKKYKANSSGLGWVDINIAASIFENSYELFTFDANLQAFIMKIGCSTYL